jgi:hypothetical protein
VVGLLNPPGGLFNGESMIGIAPDGRLLACVLPRKSPEIRTLLEKG